jgi:hypothetical protein
VVIVARDNDTREELNAAAREPPTALGLLGEGRSYGALTVAVGDRVICRQNDARLDLDNGMRGTVCELDSHRMVIETDAGAVRELPASYADEHVEHAYALTGHSMQGGTVERAIVVVSPSDLTAGWSYTALSRARGETRLLIVDDEHAERSEFAPAGSPLLCAPLLARVGRRMRERDDEDLAIEHVREREHPACAEPQVVRRAQARLADLDARMLMLNTKHKRLAQALAGLPESRWRGGRPDQHDVNRAQLTSALDVLRRDYAALSTERQVLARELGERPDLPRGRRVAERAEGEHTRARLGAGDLDRDIGR